MFEYQFQADQYMFEYPKAPDSFLLAGVRCSLLSLSNSFTMELLYLLSAIEKISEYLMKFILEMSVT
jgi:hypothetical protein